MSSKKATWYFISTKVYKEGDKSYTNRMGSIGSTGDRDQVIKCYSDAISWLFTDVHGELIDPISLPIIYEALVDIDDAVQASAYGSGVHIDVINILDPKADFGVSRADIIDQARVESISRKLSYAKNDLKKYSKDCENVNLRIKQLEQQLAKFATTVE